MAELSLRGLLSAVLSRFTARCEAGTLQTFQSGGRKDPRLIDVALRLGISLLISLGISMLAGRYLVQFIDPQHKGRQQAKKSKDELMKRLGRANIKTNEHEDMIAQVPPALLPPPAPTSSPRPPARLPSPSLHTFIFCVGSKFVGVGVETR